MEAQKVVNTVLQYLENQMVPGMTELQETLFYGAWETFSDELEAIIPEIIANPITRAIAAMDKNGNVDEHKLIRRIRKVMDRKGKISFNIPLYGPISILPDDLDAIEAALKSNEHDKLNGNVFGG